MMGQDQPLDRMTWVQPHELHGNDYNPNRVFPPELDLLKRSILEDGWTQPIVAQRDGTIVDGFHRWHLVMTDAAVRDKAHGFVPVVYLDPEKTREDCIFSTVRHNRARGKHGILKMSALVRELKSDGVSDKEIMARMGMESEEVDRLSEVRPSTELHGKDSFGKGWVPDGTRGRV